ncbi:MAG: DUF2156 domain-containing protein [Clostridia bacterium]|nr:DUF2156 domain-containing protein [Clostridia bacterium]
MSSCSFEIKPITLSDKPLFDSYFKNATFMNSDFTFTNLFMWKKAYNIRYAEINGCLCIFSRYKNAPESVTFPLGKDPEIALGQLIDFLKSQNTPFLIRIFSREQKSLVKHFFPDTFNFEKDMGNSDYVYKTSDLVELPGARYHAKRNHINKFKSLYDFEYRSLTPADKDECKEMFSYWCSTKQGKIENIAEQLEAVGELLDNWESLDIKGGGIFVDGKMVAFSFGEVLNQNKSIAVIHLEHANTDFQGSFAIMNQQFAENQWSHLQFINREEDMGLEGLRKAKKSYYPVFMVEKYMAVHK